MIFFTEFANYTTQKSAKYHCKIT